VLITPLSRGVTRKCLLRLGTNTPNHTLHEFGINVPPGYKRTVTPHNLIYLPINCDEISTRIVDQNGDLVNLRGENVSIRMHIRLIE